MSSTSPTTTSTTAPTSPMALDPAAPGSSASAAAAGLGSEVSIVPIGCPHYRRKCKFFTPCCNKTYRCRFCHDSAEDHVLQREDVELVVCSSCSEKQPLATKCRKCSTLFGRYVCFECKLFDDDAQEQFHCDGCGICRIGGRKNFFHCPVCNMCLPNHLEGNHKCIENISRTNCPICLEDIHTSREPSQIPPCNHLIHRKCFDQMVRAGHYCCPICAKSMIDMTEMWKLYDQHIADTPLPLMYQKLFAEVYCRDCQQMSMSLFHVIAMKCRACGSYNTVRNKGPLLRKQNDGSFQEADLREDTDSLPVPAQSHPESQSTSSSSTPLSSGVTSPPAISSESPTPVGSSLIGGLVRGAQIGDSAIEPQIVLETSVEDWDIPVNGVEHETDGKATSATSSADKSN